jgi:hypothetical protein
VYCARKSDVARDKINLSRKEIAEVVAFMRALTDPIVKEYAY